MEVLALMGSFGFLWSCLQAAALESRQLRTVVWTPEVPFLHKCFCHLIQTACKSPTGMEALGSLLKTMHPCCAHGP